MFSPHAKKLSSSNKSGAPSAAPSFKRCCNESKINSEQQSRPQGVYICVRSFNFGGARRVGARGAKVLTLAERAPRFKMRFSRATEGLGMRCSHGRYNFLRRYRYLRAFFACFSPEEKNIDFSIFGHRIFDFRKSIFLVFGHPMSGGFFTSPCSTSQTTGQKRWKPRTEMCFNSFIKTKNRGRLFSNLNRTFLKML